MGAVESAWELDADHAIAEIEAGEARLKAGLGPGGLFIIHSMETFP